MNTMKFASVRRAAIILACPLLLAGCGGEKLPKEEASVPRTPATGVVRWAVQGAALPVYRELASDFAKRNSGMSVEILPFDQMSDLLNVLLDKKPEVISMSTEFALQCIDTQLLRDMTPYFRREAFWNQLIKEYARNLGPKGKTYALPYFASVSALNYNKPLFKDAGLAYPTPKWTYEAEFYLAAKKLTRDMNGDGRTEQRGLVGGVYAEWLPVFYSWGAEFLSMDGLKLLFKDNAALESLRFVQRLHKEGLADVRLPDAEFTPEKAPFVDGLTGMFMDSKPWTPGVLRALPPSVKMDVGYTSVPVGRKGSIAVSSSRAIGIYVLGRNKGGAAQFIRYLFNTDAQMLAYDSDGFMPTTKGAFTLAKLVGRDRSEDPIVRSYEHAKVFGADAISRIVLDGIKSGMYYMVNEGAEPEELLKAAKDEFYKMLKEKTGRNN